jgi:CDP-glycerol glycerophosphotransferase (TagB/SpsB family)
VPANLREIQPTFFFAVPRIWEKLLATAQVKQAAASRTKKAVSRVGLRLAATVGATLERTGGKHTAASRVQFALAWVLVVRALRERLGLPEDRMIVLYAPTYRDHVRDRKGRYRLDLHLDVERLRSALGDRAVILFRKHHYVADAAPSTPDGFVRDVSRFPDANELMLAADVLVTDYSSAMVDFASTGRPILLFAYDLEDYPRGFYVDYEATVPGPVLRTTGEVAEALESTSFERLGARFDAIAYGGREAGAEDAGSAREDWAEVLSAAGAR